MLITTQNFQINQSSNYLKSKQKNNLNINEPISYTNNPQKILPQHFHSQVSFGMINPVLKKSMRSPIFLQMKTMKNLWHEFNCLSPKIGVLPIQQIFKKNIKQYLEDEKTPSLLYNENEKAIQISETQERYESFYRNQHKRWQNFFVENISCDLLNSTPDDLFSNVILNCRKKIPLEIEKNKEKLETLKQDKEQSPEIKKQIEKTTKLLKLQQNYLQISNDESLIIDTEALKLSSAQGVIRGLRHKNFVVFKHNIPVFQNALERYINYQIINPPNLVEQSHPSEKELSSLSKIIGVIPNKPTFSQCMKYAFLEDIYDSKINIKPIHSKTGEEIGIFANIPQTNHDDPQLSKHIALVRYLSHSNWCTKFKSASSYLQNADFLCFTPYEGGRKICLVVENGNNIQSLESAENQHTLDEKDYETFAGILNEVPELVQIVKNSPYKELLDKINTK